MANKKEIINFVEKTTGRSVEFKKNNDTNYIKFDFLPLALREFIHSLAEYDEKRMVLLPRDCQCGHAYFYEEAHFFELCKKIKKIEELK